MSLINNYTTPSLNIQNAILAYLAMSEEIRSSYKVVKISNLELLHGIKELNPKANDVRNYKAYITTYGKPSEKELERMNPIEREMTLNYVEMWAAPADFRTIDFSASDEEKEAFNKALDQAMDDYYDKGVLNLKHELDFKLRRPIPVKRSDYNTMRGDGYENNWTSYWTLKDDERMYINSDIEVFAIVPNENKVKTTKEDLINLINLYF